MIPRRRHLTPPSPDGIPVYEVRSGVIKIDMTAGVTDKYDKLIAGGINIQPRWG